MNSETLSARTPVWIILSEFFLDTEHSATEILGFGRALAQSPYSLEELRLIERYEVAPVLYLNLLSVAGQWAGFEQESLLAECEKEADKGRGLIRRVHTRMIDLICKNYTSDFWKRLEPEFRRTRIQN